MAEETSEEKLLAVARHIAETLGHTGTTPEDILHIFSDFDNRFRHKLTPNQINQSSHEALKSLDRRISPFLSSDRPIWSSSASSSTSFLDSIDDLISLINTHPLPPAEDLLHLSMLRLQQEFKALVNLDNNNNDYFNDDNDDEEQQPPDENLAHNDLNIPVARPVTDFNLVIDALPSGTISDLNSIAKRMVSGRYAAECCHVYSSSRTDFLEESLSRLGLRRHLSLEEIHKMTWPDLEDEIERWRGAVTVSLLILFPSERRLCDRVFLGLASAADLAFMEASRSTAIRLLGFADAVAAGSRAPERLFKVLDVYETVRDLFPEFKSVFSDKFCVFLKNEAVSIWKRLGEAIRGIFMELENLIRRDPAKVEVSGGGLHPITRYVMNYLRAACRSRKTLEQVFEGGAIGVGDLNSLNSSSLSVQMGWIMELLESNLEAKSRIYNDPALCSIFMMNNGKYIVQKVRDDELGFLLGDDWIRKRTAKIRQYHMNYQRNSWNKVLGLLKLDSSDLGSNGGSNSRVMREKLKAFYTGFDEICRTQSAWVVFDEQLKDEIKLSIVGNLSPKYRTFLGRFQDFPDIGKHDKYIKYSVEELEAHISELFRGSPGSANGRK